MKPHSSLCRCSTCKQRRAAIVRAFESFQRCLDRCLIYGEGVELVDWPDEEEEPVQADTTYVPDMLREMVEDER